MRTLILVILSATLCLGESCWWSETAKAKESVDTRTDSSGKFYNFEKNRNIGGYTITYFCIEGKLFVGAEFNGVVGERPTDSITQVFRNGNAMQNVFVERCKCREE